MKILFFETDKDNIGLDKVVHFLVCFCITIAVAVVANKWLMAELGDCVVMGTAVALMTGVGKELYDKFVSKTCFDVYDFIADVLGIALAAFTMLCLV